MARRPALDREEVFQAADTLKAEGKEVSAVALLDALGGGSLRTIYKHMEEWQKEQPKETSNGQKTEMPDSVLTAFMSTWRTAAAEAAKETAAVREKAAQEVKEAQKQFAGALEIIEKFEIESEASAQQIESMKARIEELESVLHKEENERAAVAATAEQLRQQVKSLEGELERLHSRTSQSQEKAEKAMTEAAELRGKVEALSLQNKELLSRLKEPDDEEKAKKRK